MNSIQKIGLDKVSLSVSISKLNMEQLLKHKKKLNITYNEGSPFYGIQYFKIMDNRRFSTLRAGIRKVGNGCRVYCHLDICLSFINKEKNNLRNISMEEYRKAISSIIDYLADEYGVFIDKTP